MQQFLTVVALSLLTTLGVYLRKLGKCVLSNFVLTLPGAWSPEPQAVRHSCYNSPQS